MILASILDPKMAPKNGFPLTFFRYVSQGASKTPQERPKSGHKRPKRASRGSKTAPRALQERPREPQEPNKSFQDAKAK